MARKIRILLGALVPLLMAPSTTLAHHESFATPLVDTELLILFAVVAGAVGGAWRFLGTAVSR